MVHPGLSAISGMDDRTPFSDGPAVLCIHKADGTQGVIGIAVLLRPTLPAIVCVHNRTPSATGPSLQFSGEGDREQVLLHGPVLLSNSDCRGQKEDQKQERKYGYCLPYISVSERRGPICLPINHTVEHAIPSKKLMVAVTPKGSPIRIIQQLSSAVRKALF